MQEKNKTLVLESYRTVMSESHLERMDEFVCESYLDYNVDSRKRGHAAFEAHIKSNRHK